MREHVKALQKQWAREYGTKRISSHEIQALFRRKAELEYERRMCIDRHEFETAAIKTEEWSAVKKRLKEAQPVSYKTYATREFAKDFIAVTEKIDLTEQDRMFFRIYYCREYLGHEVKETADLYGISTRKYYQIYNAGIAKFFPGEVSEELSEVG